MSAHQAPRPPAPSAASPPRVLLARLACAKALAADGVAAGDVGPSGVWQTADGDDVLEGIVVTARSDGRLDVALHLVAGWPTPPLHAVAAEIRDGVSSAAGDAGLGERLGELSVSFGDLQEPRSVGEAS